MSEGEPSDPLARLGERLARARSEATPRPPAGSEPGGALAFGLRIGAELVAALGVGVGLGLLADYLFGTRPLFLIVFFFVGAAAGVLNVIRATQGVGRQGGPPRHERD